jgi:hypothetical protein
MRLDELLEERAAAGAVAGLVLAHDHGSTLDSGT